MGVKLGLSLSRRNTSWQCVHFGPKRDEETGEWRRLHNKKLYDMYCSPNIG